jgi:hypothetical protein
VLARNDKRAPRQSAPSVISKRLRKGLSIAWTPAVNDAIGLPNADVDALDFGRDGAALFGKADKSAMVCLLLTRTDHARSLPTTDRLRGHSDVRADMIC